MITGNPTLVKNYISGAAVNARRIVKWDSSDNAVIQGAAATDALIGVADLGCTAASDRLDVIHQGIVPVEFGGTVTRGGPVTADSNGKAVAASPSAGSNVRIIGFAMASAVSGDVALVLIAPGLMQG